MSHRRHLLFAVLLSLGVTLAVAPSSSAEEVVRHDARHDVVDHAGDAIPGVPKPGQADPDVVRTIVAHRDHQVVIRVWFAELRPHKPRGLWARLVIPGETPYTLFVLWRRDGSVRDRLLAPLVPR